MDRPQAHESSVPQVIKRDGHLEPFDPSRIRRAIERAAEASGGSPAGAELERVCSEVMRRIERLSWPPSVEQIQDVVERTLAELGYSETAKSYIIYRRRRAELREAKEAIGVHDDLKLSVNAARLLKARYLLKNERGEVIERPSEMLRRVARVVARADALYGVRDTAQTEEAFYRMMASFDFLPNSPTLMNAGTRLGQLAACFVLPVGDSIREIFAALSGMALIHQSGGGTGFSFSRLRPAGDVVKSTAGVASGPVSFMRIFDIATEVIKQGGRRRGANMGVLRVDHPDIREFITAKLDGHSFRNFNLSVGVTDIFMECVEKDESYELINPRTGRPVRSLRARDVFELIALCAWRCGDPGLIFLDEIARHNPTPHLGEIESTNPCGEQPLLPYEACNLGSINLANMVRDGRIDWDRFASTVELAVHFLDNVIDVNRYPLPAVRRATLGNRKIGLGVMGFAEMLILLGIPYDSEEAVATAERVARFLSERSVEASVQLGRERGSFPNFRGSIWERRGLPAMRNAAITTVAPTGSISILANVSSGIEPLFAICFFRNVLDGARLFEENRLFRRAAERAGIYSQRLIQDILRQGGVRKMEPLPEELRRLFPTALEISPEWHVRIQAAFQKHVHSGVSKTVNLPPEATQADVARVYRLAWQLKCKGITVFRSGSSPGQVLEPGLPHSENDLLTLGKDFCGECRECAT